MGSLRHSLLVVVAFGGCGDCSGGGFPDARPIDGPPPPGQFSLAWSIVDTGNRPVPCDDIGAISINASLHPASNQAGKTEVFSCPAGATMGNVTSSSLAIDRYSIDFELAGGVGQLATSPQQRGISIQSGQVTPLSPVTFTLNATGGLALHFNTGKAGGNCGTIANNGAGITANTITLEHTGAGCQPVTFAIAAGATRPAGTYTVNCGSPQVVGCIENDQAITAMNVPSDNYTIHVRGKIGATDCWVNNDAFQVPPLAMVLTQTLNLMKLNIAGC